MSAPLCTVLLRVGKPCESGLHAGCAKKNRMKFSMSCSPSWKKEFSIRKHSFHPDGSRHGSQPLFLLLLSKPTSFWPFDFQRFSGFHCLVQVPMSTKHGLPLWSLSSSTGCGPHLLSDIRGVDKNAQNTFFTCSQSELTSRTSPPGKSLGCTTSLDLVSSSDP